MPMELMTRRQETIEALLEDFLGQRAAHARADEAAPWAPAVNVRETDEAIALYCGLPGVDKHDVQGEVRDNTLVLAGQRKAAKEGGGWLRQEAFSGAFYRAFTLPAEVQAGKVSAVMTNGVLEIRL